MKHILQLAIGAIANLLIGLITTPIITRLVDPNENGQLSLFTTYSSIALMIFTLGLDQTFVRYYYVNREISYKKALFKICIGIPLLFATIGSIVLVIVYFLCPNLIGFNSIVVCFFILNIYVLILNRFGMLVLRLKFRTALYSAMNILHKLLYVIIVIPFAVYFKRDYLLILVFATVISVMVSTLVCVVCERKFWFLENGAQNLKVSNNELLKFGFPLMIASGVFLLFQATDKLCIKLYGTYSDVGVYSSAQTLMTVFSIIQSTFNTLWAPKAIEYYENNPNDRTYFVRMNRIITVLMFSFGSAVLLGKDLFVLLLGEKYREASSIIPFLMFNPIMYTISETTVSGLAITKHTKCQVYITGISASVNLFGNLFLIPILGSKGAAVSTGLSYIVFFTLRTAFSNHYFPVNYRLFRFYILTFIFALGCWYHMFHSFDYIIVAIFVITLCLIVFLYRDAFKDMFSLSKVIMLKIRNAFTKQSHFE